MTKAALKPAVSANPENVKLGVGKAEFVVNGMDLAPFINHIEITAGVGEVPTVTLTMPLPKIVAEVDQVYLRLDEKTEHALRILGWTPPPVPHPPVSTATDLDRRPFFSSATEESLRAAGWEPGPNALLSEQVDQLRWTPHENV